MASRVAEVLADARPGKRGNKLERCGDRRGCVYDHGILHRPVFFQRALDLGDGRGLLSDGDVDAIDGGVCFVRRLLADHGIDKYRGFAGLTVANDEFALSAADRNHGVDRLDPRKQRLKYRFAVDDARRLALERHFAGFPCQCSEAVQRLPQRVDNTPEHAVGDLDRGDPLCAARLVALLDLVGAAEEDYTNVILFQVQHHAGDFPLGEFDEFAGLDLRKAVQPGDAIAYLQHRAYFVDIRFRSKAAELLSQYGGYLIGSNRRCHYRYRKD